MSRKKSLIDDEESGTVFSYNPEVSCHKPLSNPVQQAEWELGEEWGRKMGVWKTVIHAAKQDLARWQFWGIVVVGNVRQVISTRTHKAISTEVHKCWFGIQASHYLCCHPSLHFYKSLLARTEGLKENRAAHCTWLLGGKNKGNLCCRSGLLVQVKVDLFWLTGITPRESLAHGWPYRMEDILPLTIA